MTYLDQLYEPILILINFIIFQVVKQRCWGDIYKRLGLPNPNVSNIINLKSAYERYLQAYEDFFRKLGSSMCDLVSLRHSSSATGSKRSSVSDSHRSLYKNRYQTPATTSSQKTKPIANKTKKQTPNPNSSTANEAPSSPASSTQKSMLDTPKPKRLSIDDITDENNMSDTSHNKEITIESLVNNNLMASNSSIDEQQQPEELTLFSMLEDSKKAKRLEEEKKKKLKLEEQQQQQQPDYSSDSEKKDAKASKEDKSKSSTPNQAQKRPLSVQSAKQKGTRSSTEKLKIKTEAKEDEPEDDGEPKAKKKASRLSTSDDATTLKSTGLKRKSSISKALTDANDESENEKDTSSQDGTNESNMDIDVSENSDRNISINDLEVHTALDVKYGNTNQQYRAKVLNINYENQTVMVHYLGWNTRYDEYIKLDKIVRVIRIPAAANCQKRRKTKNNSTNSTSSENQAAASPSANSKTNNQGKNVTTQKISKRSSSSTASSSYSSTDQPLEATKANNAESSASKTTSKTRNSDSVSSNSSTNSLKRESSEDLDKKSSLASSTSSASSVLPLITPTSIPNTIETPRVFEVKQEKETKAKEEKSKASVDANEKKADKSAELSNSLLSIKEEIMDEIKSEPSANILDMSLQTDKGQGNDVEKVASRRSSMNTRDNELNSPKILTPKGNDAPIAELHKLNSPKERSSPRTNLNEDKAESVKKSPSCSSINTHGSKTANSKNESKSAHKDKQKESEALVNEPIGAIKALENVNESKTNATPNECSSSNAKSTINHNSNDKSKQIEVNNLVDSTKNHVAETNKDAETNKKNTTIASPVVEGKLEIYYEFSFVLGLTCFFFIIYLRS